MKVLVAGGTGAIGRVLVPELLRNGYAVAAIGRSQDALRRVADLGAQAHVCDVFDRASVARVMQAVSPDVVIDELTSLPASLNPRRLEAVYEDNNRIRRDGGGNVLEAAQRTGVRRLLIQSSAYWYDPAGPAPKDEDDSLFVGAPEPIGEAVRTIAAVETRALESELEVVILRYGLFYGPGTWYSAAGDVGQQVKRRLFPVIGDGEGVFSFVHVDDAARATAMAVTAPPGIYNIVDDAPVRLSEWLPALAEALDARPPRRVPEWLARMVAGNAMVTWMKTLKGASNARAKSALGWTPTYPSYKEGFRKL
jgi:2-alkyl-3-oxoalkanoate reductase